MAKSKPMKTTQTVLGVVFMVAMLLGFMAVAYIDYAYAQPNDQTLLWETDSDADIGDNLIPFDEPWYHQTWKQTNCQRLDSDENDHIQENRTVIYSGNDTYSMSVASWGVGDTAISTNYALMVFEIPNADKFIVQSLELTSSCNGDDSMYVNVMMASVDDDLWPSGEFTASNEPIGWNVNFDYSLTTLDNQSYDVPLSDGIHGIEKAQEHDKTYLLVSVGEGTTKDGMTAFTWDVNIQLYGESVSTWTLRDSVFGALAGSVALNIGVVVYLTDGIDLGGYTKKLRKKRW